MMREPQQGMHKFEFNSGIELSTRIDFGNQLLRWRRKWVRVRALIKLNLYF
jgi:hypothetical protein